MSNADRVLRNNRLLAALPPEEYEQLFPYLEPLSLKAKDVLYAADREIEYVYFLQSGVAALLTRMNNGCFVEVVTVGNEAMVGLPIFLGMKLIERQACWQILPGEALRMRADAFVRVVSPNTFLYKILHMYTLSLFSQIIHLSACNCLHSVKERCCRLLLIVHDQLGSEPLLLTHEFLAQILGVRRASISQVANNLQQSGLLCYTRGKIHILDRPGLEAQACECYSKIKNEYDNLIVSYENNVRYRTDE